MIQLLRRHCPPLFFAFIQIFKQIYNINLFHNRCKSKTEPTKQQKFASSDQFFDVETNFLDKRNRVEILSCDLSPFTPTKISRLCFICTKSEWTNDSFVVWVINVLSTIRIVRSIFNLIKFGFGAWDCGCVQKERTILLEPLQNCFSIDLKFVSHVHHFGHAFRHDLDSIWFFVISLLAFKRLCLRPFVRWTSDSFKRIWLIF